MKKLNQDGPRWTSNEPFSVEELRKMVEEQEKEMEHRRLLAAYALSSVDYTKLSKDGQSVYEEVLKHCLTGLHETA